MNEKHRNHMTPRRQRRRGFTLTEIAIVLGIVGLILGAIWVAAAAVYNNLRVSHANTEILQIAQATRALYGNANTLGVTAATDITDTLICAKAVPSDMQLKVCGGPGTLIDPFPAGLTGIEVPASADSFTVVMSAVPQANCVDLLMAVGGTNRDPGLFAAQAVANAAPAVADAVATVPPSTLVATATPALANSAAPAANFGGCMVSGAGASVKVQFAFGLKS